MGSIIRETSEGIYEELAADTRDKLYPGKAEYMTVIFSKLAPVFYAETQLDELMSEQIKFINSFHVNVFSRRIMTRMATGWSIEDANTSIIRQYPHLSLDTVQQAINVSMEFLNKQFPQVENRDKELSQLATMRDQVTGLEQNAKSNEAVINLHINDPEYGLIPNKPIFTAGFPGERAYVDRLISSDGRSIKYQRVGSKEVDGLYGPVDIFRLCDSDGRETTIYISLYANTTSEKAPAGFELKRASNSQSANTRQPPRFDKSKTQKTASMMWEEQGLCKFCGGNVGGFFVKKCKSCGKAK
jgi:hypothetical protein